MHSHKNCARSYPVFLLEMKGYDYWEQIRNLTTIPEMFGIQILTM